MKKILIVFTLIIYCFSSPQAQGYKKAKRGFRRTAPTTAMSHRLSAALERQERARISLESLPAPLNTAVFTVRENHRLLRRFHDGKVTSFAFEDATGKKWGVTTPHGHFLEAVTLDHQTGKRLPIPAAHSAGLWDIAIFELPTELADRITPLRLATQPPAIGETLYGVGFYEGEYHLETGLVTQKLGPNRLVTSLDFDRACQRWGACGGPLLNEAGEVVGIHVGNHNKQNIGFDVPIQKLHELLKEVQQGVMSQEPLMFNGKKIGTIFRNQLIRSIQAYRDNKLIQTKKTYLHENEVDYAHLEQFIGDIQADKLVLHIAESMLPSQHEKQSCRAFSLTYDMITGETNVQQHNLKHPFYTQLSNYFKARIAKILPDQIVILIRSQKAKHRRDVE